MNKFSIIIPFVFLNCTNGAESFFQTGSSGDIDAGTSDSGVGGSGSSTASTSAVSNSSSVASGCDPQSCLDQGKNCGVIDNTCGHKEDCGKCSGDYQVCGDTAGEKGAGNGVSNVCGGGCAVTDIGFNPCGPPNSWAVWGCNEAGAAFPAQGSFPMGNEVGHPGTLPTQFWCVPIN